MGIDRRTFVTLTAGALLSRRQFAAAATGGTDVRSMLKPAKDSGLSARVLATVGDSIGGYRPPGIMDGMGAWRWDKDTVRLFVNHELPPDKGYAYSLANGTQLRGARISWFDIDRPTRTISGAGCAINEIRDR